MTDTISIQIKIKAATSVYIQDDSVNYRLQNTKSPQSHSIRFTSRTVPSCKTRAPTYYLRKNTDYSEV